MSGALEPSETLNALLLRAAPVTDVELARLEGWPSATVVAGAAADPEWAPTRKPRRRRAVVLVTVAAALALAGASLAATGVMGVHTGLFGKPGATENDTSEWLDSKAPEFPGVARDLGRGIPFPPGDSVDPYIPGLVHDGGLIQTSGVRASLSASAECAWEGYWLQAHRVGDAKGLADATVVLAEIPSWKGFANADSTTIDWDTREATTAAAGDPTMVQQSWNANCTTLPRAWQRG